METYNHPVLKFAARAAALLLALLLLPLGAAVSAASPSGGSALSYASPYAAVLDHLQAGAPPVYGSIGGEWKLLALARSGRVAAQSAYAGDYFARIEARVAANGSAKLENNQSTGNSRVIIALTSIGRDARNVAGFDLTEPLADFTYVKRQGINGAIFALIALNTNSAYGMAAAKQSCIDFILSREIPGGGWALVGSNPDPDITAMAITALAPYSSARAAVDRGLERLSALQDTDGGFSSMGLANCESCAQVLTALSAAGIDAASDARFIKGGNTVLDALLGFFVGTGFAHTAGGGVNAMSSEQAAYALCAYDRLAHGRNSLYNMNDVQFVSAEPTPAPTPAPTQTPAPTPAPTPASTAAATAAPSAAPTGAPAETSSVSPIETPEATEALTPYCETTHVPSGSTGPADESPMPDKTPEATEALTPWCETTHVPSGSTESAKKRGAWWLVFPAAALLAGGTALLIHNKKTNGK